MAYINSLKTYVLQFFVRVTYSFLEIILIHMSTGYVERSSAVGSVGNGLESKSD